VQAFSGIGQEYLVSAVKSYQDLYADVDVELALSHCADYTLEPGFDTALVVAHRLKDSWLVGIQLGETYDVLCAAPSYLSRIAPVMASSQLRDFAFVSLTDGAKPTRRLPLAGQDDHVEVTIRPKFTVDSYHSMATGIAQGMGVGVLPIHATLPALLDGRL
jgi:DNA-binding transcriptional LysR family regulator